MHLDNDDMRKIYFDDDRGQRPFSAQAIEKDLADSRGDDRHRTAMMLMQLFSVLFVVDQTLRGG